MAKSYRTLVSSELNMPEYGKLFTQVVTNYGKKKTMTEIAEKLEKKVRQYIPNGDTGKLRNKGYEIKVGIKKGVAYSLLRYRNTEEVPYVLYQYYGRVYGFNYAHWVPVITRKSIYENNPYAMISPQKITSKYEQFGWVSEKGVKKRPMNRYLGEKRTIHLKDGRTIKIDGYSKTKKKPHKKWLEWYVNQPEYYIFFNDWRRDVIAEVTQKYQEKLNRGR